MIGRIFVVKEYLTKNENKKLKQSSQKFMITRTNDDYFYRSDSLCTQLCEIKFSVNILSQIKTQRITKIFIKYKDIWRMDIYLKEYISEGWKKGV